MKGGWCTPALSVLQPLGRWWLAGAHLVCCISSSWCARYTKWCAIRASYQAQMVLWTTSSFFQFLIMPSNMVLLLPCPSSTWIMLLAQYLFNSQRPSPYYASCSVLLHTSQTVMHSWQALSRPKCGVLLLQNFTWGLPGQYPITPDLFACLYPTHWAM